MRNCVSVVTEHWNICRYASVAGFTTANTFCGVSAITMTAISVDRLLALLLGLRYKKVVTLKRAYVIVNTFWVVCRVCSAMWFWSPVITLFCGIILTSLCLIFSVFFTQRFSSNSKSISRPCSTTEPNQSTKHNAIQKGSVHCNMAATDAGRLLSILWRSDDIGA